MIAFTNLDVQATHPPLVNIPTIPLRYKRLMAYNTLFALFCAYSNYQLNHQV